MSELINKAGIAFKLPFTEHSAEVVDFLRERNIDCEDFEDDWVIETKSKDFEVSQGENNLYLLVLKANTDCQDLEILLGYKDLLNTIESFKLEGLKCRFFAFSWYTGVDSPVVYWNW